MELRILVKNRTIVRQGNLSVVALTLIEVSLFQSLISRLILGYLSLYIDGLSDVVIGAVHQDDLTYTSAGATYVVFGTTATTPISLKYLASVFTYSSPEASSYDSASPNFVKNVGDIDLNGYTDIGIGFFENAAAYLILGNKNGADSIASLQGISSNEGYFINSTNLESWLGYSLDSAGDMNNDGFSDWMIGAPGKYSYFPYYADYIFYYSTPTIASNSIPAVYIIYGGKSVQSLTVSNYSLNYPDRGTVITGDRTSGLGISVAYVPNLFSKTNNQRTFIALGAPFTSNYDGAVYIIAGSSSLPSQIKLTQPSQVAELGIITITAVPGSKGYLGWAVSSAGDIDGDGYTDVLIAAPQATINNGGTTVYNCGVIYLLYGKSLQAGATIALESFTSNQGLLFYGVNVYDNAGMAVSGIGDINGDGYADYAIGVPYYNSFTGITYIIYGNSAFSTSTISLGSISSSQGFTLNGDQTNDFSGFAIAPAGDINHDGLADVIISSPGNNIYAGTVYIVFGAKQGSMTSNSIDLSSLTSDQGVIIVNNVLYTMVGWSVSSYTDTKGSIMALVGMNPSTAYGETSTAYAIIPSSSPKNTTVTPTARPTVYPTYVPTALPTWSPSAIPTYIPSLTPTMAPTVPPFWQANQAIILGVLIPATTSFIPIYFSKQICFNALEHWSALNRRRNLFQIGIYNLCKKIYLADYMEALETKKAKKDHDKEEKDKEALLKPNIELTVLEKLKQMKDSEGTSSSIMMSDDMSSSHGVMNPMLPPSDAERSPSFQRSTLHIEEERNRQSVAFRQSTTLIDSDDEDEDARGRDEEEGGGGLPPHPLSGRGSGSGKGGNDVIVKAVYSFTYDNPEIELMMSQNSFPLSSILGDIKLLPLELPKAEETSIPSVEETKIVNYHEMTSSSSQSLYSVGLVDWLEHYPLFHYFTLMLSSYYFTLLPLSSSSHSSLTFFFDFYNTVFKNKLILFLLHWIVGLSYWYYNSYKNEKKGAKKEDHRRTILTTAKTILSDLLLSPPTIRSLIFGFRLLCIHYLSVWFLSSFSSDTSDQIAIASYCSSLTAVYSLQSVGHCLTSGSTLPLSSCLSNQMAVKAVMSMMECYLSYHTRINLFSMKGEMSMFLLVTVVLFIVKYCYSYLFFHVKSRLCHCFFNVVGEKEDISSGSGRYDDDISAKDSSYYYYNRVLFFLQRIVFLDYLIRLFLILLQTFFMKDEEVQVNRLQNEL